MCFRFNQFNGCYSWAKCLQEGQNVKTDKGVGVFAYELNNPTGPSRTHQDTVTTDKKIVKSLDKKTVNDFKGQSALMFLSD